MKTINIEITGGIEEMQIEAPGVCKRDLEMIADELVCDGYAEEGTVKDGNILLTNMDLLTYGAEDFRLAVSEMLEELCYQVNFIQCVTTFS